VGCIVGYVIQAFVGSSYEVFFCFAFVQYFTGNFLLKPLLPDIKEKKL
jgi:hypothetical protein